MHYILYEYKRRVELAKLCIVYYNNCVTLLLLVGRHVLHHCTLYPLMSLPLCGFYEHAYFTLINVMMFCAGAQYNLPRIASYKIQLYIFIADDYFCHYFEPMDYYSLAHLLMH